MKTKVTEQGVLVPKGMLEGVEEVEIREQDGLVIIVPVARQDPVFNIGKNPIDDDITDASVNHDRYIYNGE
jgi:virulence-associated protein VagC